MNSEDYKQNGQYYTPENLASFLAKSAIICKDSDVFDPSYGKGSLLLASRDRLLELGAADPSNQLFGIDILPPCKEYQIKHFKGSINPENLLEGDFFSLNNLEVERKFDVIIMNPPFIRHHGLTKKRQEQIHNLLGKKDVPFKMDLWGYFLIHVVNFLKEGGSIGGIFPWSLLQAEYAKKIREFLLGQFESIQVHLIGKQMFENTKERVLILVCHNYRKETQKIKFHYSYEILNEEVSYVIKNHNTWLSSPWDACVSSEAIQRVKEIASDLNFKPLSQFADVKIGIVTGANSFFILDNDNISTWDIPSNFLIPIINRSSKLNQFSLSPSQVENYLLSVPEESELPNKLKEYISSGEQKGLHTRYHTRKRKKWYCIEDRKPSDAFLHYMTKETPYIVFNPENVLCTNAIHRIYFHNNIDKEQQKWIQFTILSSISQFFVETLGRTYGDAILKLEPGKTANVVVAACLNRSYPHHLEKEIQSYLKCSNKRAAMKIVDDWFIQSELISKENMEYIQDHYKLGRDLRLRR